MPMILGDLRGEDLPLIDELEAVVHRVRAEDRLFIRYSEGPDRDRTGPSTDYESGLVLPGLSVTVLTPPEWWTLTDRAWVARRMCKYADLMDAPRRPRPWLLTGREVGLGPDHEPLIAEATPIAWVGQSALAAAVGLYRTSFVVGQDARSLPARTAADA